MPAKKSSASASASASASLSPLGPLARRTLKGGALNNNNGGGGNNAPMPSTPPSGTRDGQGRGRVPSSSGSGSGSGSGSKSAAPATTMSKTELDKAVRGIKALGLDDDDDDQVGGGRAYASPSTSMSNPASSSYLLPRNLETSAHRSLRGLLQSFASQWIEWEAEVHRMGQVLAEWCTVVGDIEEALEDKGTSSGVRKLKAKSIDPIGNNISEASSSAIVEHLSTLDGLTRKLQLGRRVLAKLTREVVRLTDEGRAMEREWNRKAENVRWGSIGGDKLVQSIYTLASQVQLQHLSLDSSIDLLLVSCNPLGSLHRKQRQRPRRRPLSPVIHHPETTATTTTVSASSPASDSASEKEEDEEEDLPAYSPSSSPFQRKKVLQLWMDQPDIHQKGRGSFRWCQEVWRGEVGRWEG